MSEKKARDNYEMLLVKLETVDNTDELENTVVFLKSAFKLMTMYDEDLMKNLKAEGKALQAKIMKAWERFDEG